MPAIATGRSAHHCSWIPDRNTPQPFSVSITSDSRSSINSEVSLLERHVRSILNSRRRQSAPACPFRATTGSAKPYSITDIRGLRRHARFVP